MYILNDNGIVLAPTQRELTPIQRYVYLMAKDHHTEDVDTSPPSSMQAGHRVTSGF